MSRVLLLPTVAALLLAGCTDNNGGNGSRKPNPKGSASVPQSPIPPHPRVVLDTSMGSITLELDTAEAPATVENFLTYVEAGHYDGTIFHRVIPDFMIQGGGFDPSMKQRPTRAPIKNEANNGLKNRAGTVAMARTNDPHSATAQFFINVKDNAFLDYPGQDGWGYCVFGKVVDGMDVVEEIKGVQTWSLPQVWGCAHRRYGSLPSPNRCLYRSRYPLSSTGVV